MSLVAWYPLNGNLKNNCVGPDLTTNYMYGDVNKDGLVNDKDLDELHNILVGTNTDSVSKTLGDINGDGKTNIKDYNTLYKYLNNDRQIDINNRIRQASDIVRKEPVWVDGKTGKAYSNTTEVPAWANIDKIKGTKILSISFWFKADTISQFEDILGFETYKITDKSYRHLRAETNYAGSDKLIHWFNNGHLSNFDGLLIDNSPDDVALGKWVYVTSIFEEDKATMYINGKRTYSRTYPNSHDDIEFTGYFYISNDSHDNHNGASGDFRVCNVKIYNHVLSKKEILEDYKQPILHYTFENPYVMETTNIPHSISIHDNHVGEATLGSDSTGNYIIKNGMTTWSGLGIDVGGLPIKSGRYYTWSMEVMPIKDVEYVIDGNITCSNSGHGGNDGQHFDIIRGYSHLNHKLDGSDTLLKGKLESYKWTKMYFTVKVKDCTNPYISHTFVPYIPSGDSSVKVYYRNSQLEERMYDSPYTSSNRGPLTIKDNSGMGNNGTQVYQREEIPIESTTPTSAQGLTDTVSNGTHTIKGFNGTTNQCIYFGKLKYNSNYHYVGATVCYEFDVTISNITTVSGQTPNIYLQDVTKIKDGTGTWYDNPIPNDNLYKLTKNASNGTYHIYIQKKITYAPGVTNVDYYTFGIRFDYIKSGTFTISNLHAYYKDLDTSKLTIADKSVVGVHSAYFNGKNYIDCGLVTPQDIDALTLSCWAYKDDWTTLGNGNPIDSALISSINSGGFGFKVEPCVAEKLNTSINFAIYYKDKGYLEHVTSKGLCIDYSKLSTGWHLITGTADRNKAALYLDGEKVKEITHNLNKPIYNYDTTNKRRSNLLVGAEYEIIKKPQKINDTYIDDVRLYSVALTDEDVKALYNVKVKIDNKSNLYCNQLIETKSKNLASDLSEMTDIGNLNCPCNVSYNKNDKISTFTITVKPTRTYSGPYIMNKYYGGSLITNETYKYSIYVKLPKSGSWKIGEERIINSSSSPHYNGHNYEAGKWYKIENEGIATAKQVNFILYYQSGLLDVGDKIQIRDFKMYRLYDTDNYTQEITKKGQYKTFELDETPIDKLTSYKTINKYNATWLQIFHHDTNNNTVWFSNEAEALNCDSQYKFSILDQLEGFRSSDGKFEFLLEYPQDLPNQYNRWKQTDNPATTLEANKSTLRNSCYWL